LLSYNACLVGASVVSWLIRTMKIEDQGKTSSPEAGSGRITITGLEVLGPKANIKQLQHMAGPGTMDGWLDRWVGG